ncbi:TPA: hypothetical protein ACH3X2_011520 [Trebouxia sp. C0005]
MPTFFATATRPLLTASRVYSQVVTSETHEPITRDTNGASQPAIVGARELTFQEAITALEQYWAKKSGANCAILLPHNTEVGAGTMNPATFLRVNGPEPWNVCYPEPSVRPDDSRYGNNPNRVQRHTQFQVIMKPDPGNPQELYLGSLEALGIDTQAHDIRFVEDNWEAPVLGAWGLGWEVWCDGQEITQFTYFQQAGGIPLPHPAIEVTYGLERILMALQGVHHFKDIQYTASMTYGELFMQNEYEMSCYNLDEANVEGQRQRFELYQQEAQRMLDKRLPVPAYDHLLKLSHTFNLLDARGAVGMTERAECFATMRHLARQVTGLWMARREELGHPLGTIAPPAEPEPVTIHPEASTSGRTADSADFVLEVGSEELPPDDVMTAVHQLRERVPALLDRLRLGHGEVQIEATPRRLALLISQLAVHQRGAENKLRGPPAKVAFGPDGSPSKALLGFCKKNGVQADSVVTEADAKGTQYVWVVVKQPGRATGEVLAEELPLLLASLTFKRSMRWRGSTAFSRPLRWLLALHGSTALPLTYAGISASNTSRLLRNSSSPLQQVAHADEYQGALQQQNIVLSIEGRKQLIWEAVEATAGIVGGELSRAAAQELLDEVTNLVEAPTVVLGDFDPAFLSLPKEVLVMVMRKHQRYFPLYKPASQDLLPFFITVANGPIDVPTVKTGNEAVLRARFQDAQFFFQEDLKRPLAEFRELLSGTLFQKDLGTLLDKSKRVEQLTGFLAGHMGFAEHQAAAEAAARLALADLATATVTEMTVLAGVMGRIYALRQGEQPEVAQAIFESVLPRHMGDALPQTPAGITVSVADKVDSLVGLIGAGCAPTASADPSGLRRIANGLLQVLIGNNVPFDLPSALEQAVPLQPIPISQQQIQQVTSFVLRRLEQVLVDGGASIEAVRAVLRHRGNNPALAAASVHQLQAELSRGSSSVLSKVMAAFARPTRLVSSQAVDADAQVDEHLFELEEERQLLASYQQVAAKVHRTMSVPEFLAATTELVEPVDAYFDRVFVMTDDQQVKRSRLALLRQIASLSEGILDFSQLPGF